VWGGDLKVGTLPTGKTQKIKDFQRNRLKLDKGLIFSVLVQNV